MGCNCRGSRGTKPSISRSSGSSRTPQRSICTRLEALGNEAGVRIGAGGRLYLSAPLGTGGGLSVSSYLPSLSCRGSFSKLLIDLEAKLMAVFSDPSRLEKFNALLPHRAVKVGYLRTVLLEV